MATVMLTKYEKARVIGTRANILGRGAPPVIDIGDMTDIIQIATAEFEQNKIPFVLVRTFPNGTKQKIILGEGPPKFADES